MPRPFFACLACLLFAAFALVGAPDALAVSPNPLQDAYWRFEEGTAGSSVPAPAPGNEGPGEIKDSVLDYSGNANNMQAFNTDTAPRYVSTLPPSNLRSGLSNSLAFEVSRSEFGGGRDVYTNLEQIHNGIVGGAYDHDNNDGTPTIPSTTTGFTLEAAFSVFDYSEFGAIVAKEGRPGLAMGSGDQNLPTMALKVRGPQFPGDPDQGKLQIEMFDGAGNLVNILSTESMVTSQWYYAAVVNDGSTLSLYLDSNDGEGYVLQGQTAVDGALFQGINYNDADWDKNWCIGRAVYGGIDNGSPADFFTGLIDEVRLSNEALDPSQFLFETAGLPGDFDFDEDVDGTDFLLWQRGLGVDYDADDLADWRDSFGAQATAAAGAVPEPATFAMLGLVIGAGLLRRRYA